MNYSHHTGLCWGSQPDQKGFVVTGKFGLEGVQLEGYAGGGWGEEVLEAAGRRDGRARGRGRREG